MRVREGLTRDEIFVADLYLGRESADKGVGQTYNQ